jgi:fatty acid desaturase
MNTRNIFFFDAMLTPKVITVVYWLLLIAAVIAGLGTMFYTGFQYMNFGTFVRAVAITLGGAIAARIWCELMIVLFKLNENVQRLVQKP